MSCQWKLCSSAKGFNNNNHPRWNWDGMTLDVRHRLLPDAEISIFVSAAVSTEAAALAALFLLPRLHLSLRNRTKNTEMGTIQN